MSWRKRRTRSPLFRTGMNCGGSAGQVCAVTGLETAAAEGLGAEADSAPLLEPVLSYRIIPRRAWTALFAQAPAAGRRSRSFISYGTRAGGDSCPRSWERCRRILKSLIKNALTCILWAPADCVQGDHCTVEGVGHFEPLRHYAEVHLLMEPCLRAAASGGEHAARTIWTELAAADPDPPGKAASGRADRLEITDMKISLPPGRPTKAYGGRRLPPGHLPGRAAGTDESGEHAAGAGMPLSWSPPEQIGRAITDIQNARDFGAPNRPGNSAGSGARRRCRP